MSSDLPRTAVIVMGAPRSGTSAVSHLVSELGVYFGNPTHFVDPATHQHNPIFYELESLNRLNDDILEELGHVYGEFDYLAGEQEPIADGHRSFVERAQALIANELESKHLIGLKDPRFAFTLPLWDAAFLKMGYNIRFILTDRNTDDVVDSNRLVNGRSEAYNRRVAMLSVGLAAARLVSRDHIIINYDDMVESPRREAERLAGWLGLSSSNAEHASKVVRTELRHHHLGEAGSKNVGSTGLDVLAKRYRMVLDLMGEFGILELVGSLRERLKIAQQERGVGEILVSVQNSMDQLQSQVKSNSENLSALAEAANARNLAIERAAQERDLAAVKTEAELQRRIQDLEATVLERSRAIAHASTELNIARGDIGRREDEIRLLNANCLDLRHQLASVQQEYDHAASELESQRRRNAALMPLRKKLVWFYRAYGGKALLKRVLLGRSGLAGLAIQKTALDVQGDANAPPVSGATSKPDTPCHPTAGAAVVNAEPATPARLLVGRRFEAIKPLPIFASPGPDVRLNLVTDSINPGSLFGGVGTAIILSTLLADRLRAKLRVVTRTEVADAEGFAQVLACNGIDFSGNVEFDHIGVGDNQARLPICDGDRFLTTSWWTTACVLGSIPANRIDYLLQEDERMFYPHGDERLRCREVLKCRDIRIVVNTELLYRHLIKEGFDHLRENAVWFEPAFPAGMFKREILNKGGGRRKLFFYARPNNLRNLFYRGIEVLDAAVIEKLITPDEWDIVMVGKDVPSLSLGEGFQPQVFPTMGWRAYGEFIRSVDLGFCLMGTPHPSYPPLDLAASGAVVLTNKFGMKDDLRKYSDNIICSDLSVPALLDGLREAVARVRDDEARLSAFQANRMARSWPETLAKSIEFLS